ncbi:MAG: hypothetical protein ACRENS_02195 [Candidatus Eiseniibacteriota bacterium]
MTARTRKRKHLNAQAASQVRPATPRNAATRNTAARGSQTAAPGAPERWWRDGWCWAALSSVVVLLSHSLGAPLGEPVAEDFDFLHRALLSGKHTLLDGGGSLAFWRPVSHQLYYLTLGRVMLTEPRIVATLHALLMALAVWLVYRGLRANLSAPVAAVAASFPALAESTRTVLSWPSQFVDLGLWVFTAWALYETSRGRLWRALVALALALGSKELAIVGAALLPWMPGERGLRERLRWAIAMGAVAAVWACVYLWVRHSAHLELPHHLEHSAEMAKVGLPARYQWAWWNSVRAIMSLPFIRITYEGNLWLALEALGAIAFVALAMRRAWRRRDEWRWVGWGLAWFALASATLVVIYPLWQPNRSGFGSLGLGVAAAVVLEMASPLLLAGLVAVRLVAFVLSPAPMAKVWAKAPETGAFMDFDHLVRLQKLMQAARISLTHAYPKLPHHALICQNDLPLRAEYAFGGSLALQCWYRDSTLEWGRFDRFQQDTTLKPVTIVQYQPNHTPMVALADPVAMRLLIGVADQLAASRWLATLAIVDRAESLQTDKNARVMFAMMQVRRSIAFAGLGRWQDAEHQARLSMVDWPGNPAGRYWIGFALYGQNRWAECLTELDTLFHERQPDSLAVGLSRAARYQLARTGQ